MEAGLNMYTIKDLENFSGIKAHTIRIWEKRYRILEPDRTDSNIRMYSEAELKKILNVAYLNRNGIKISKIAILEEDELTGKVMDISSRHDDPDQDFQPGKILMSALKFNEDQFRSTLSPFIKTYGIETAYVKYLNPLLVKAGILWQTGTLSKAQEQFVRNTIKQFLIIEDFRLNGQIEKNGSAVAMINLSEHYSDDNFLFYKYVMKKRGYEVIFTGGVLPASEVFEIQKIKSFRYLVVNSGSFDFDTKKFEYFLNIAKSHSIRKIIFTDYHGSLEKKASDRIMITRDPGDFIRKVSQIK